MRSPPFAAILKPLLTFRSTFGPSGKRLASTIVGLGTNDERKGLRWVMA